MASAERTAPPLPRGAAEARPRGRPRKTAQERDEGNRRQVLLQAAAHQFRHQGFAATSTRDIAQRVGMQPGSPFYFFPNKEALLAEVMAEGLRRGLRLQRQRLLQGEGNPPPDERLRLLVRCHFEVLLGEQSDFVPVMLYEWRSLSAPHRHHLQQLRAQYELAWLPVLHALHREGRLAAPVHLARLLIFGALNWTVQWYRPPRSAPLRDASDRSISLEALTETAVELFLRPSRRAAAADTPAGSRVRPRRPTDRRSVPPSA